MEKGYLALKEATMRHGRLSSAGLSVLFALGLALWEIYFFWFIPSPDGTVGLFTPERLGFNSAARNEIAASSIGSTAGSVLLTSSTAALLVSLWLARAADFKVTVL